MRLCVDCWFDRFGSSGIVSGRCNLVALLRPVATAFSVVSRRASVIWSRHLALTREVCVCVGVDWLGGHMLTVDKLSLTLV
ncbi:hypothetical protein Taro_029284 [Colocasia esculenta]|uniref:Uncharacterized protein n=1 Tax=Colocasia esculenta TaxID=4460 RepID=A0A843VNM2_COLES|nr:hypothetical protein [Colocasia esculenta]